MVEVCNKNFDNAKVYCIRNFLNEEVYVGSTCQPLSKRMAKHKSSMNSTVKKGRKLYQEMTKLGADQFYIELLEEVKCENVEQLRAKECEYIRKIGTLNGLINGRTKEELTQTQEYKDKKKEQDRNWYLNNKEYSNQQSREYRENHKEEIKEWKKQHYEENKQEILEKQKQYHQENKEARNAQKREYYERTKAEQSAKRNVKLLCECGVSYTKRNATRHQNSKHHQNFLNNE